LQSDNSSNFYANLTIGKFMITIYSPRSNVLRLNASLTSTTSNNRGIIMKKFVLLLSAVLMVASLSACATTGGGGDNVKVKCPACGHEFSTDTADTGK
jgi:predicted small secreted protein